jgi:hypothetical protein
MDDHLIQEYVNNAYLAALQKSRLETAQKIQAATASLAQRGSSCLVAPFTRGRRFRAIPSTPWSRLKQTPCSTPATYMARRSAMRFGPKCSPSGANLIAHITTKDSGLPPDVPAANMFKSMLKDNTGAIVNTIACQIEHRKVAPKFKRSDIGQTSWRLRSWADRLHDSGSLDDGSISKFPMRRG